jgi:CRISPR-associated endonuclease/helicase Cas3
LLNTGVDLDFPLVIRAIAGVDELLQALGRFNRSFSGKASEFVVIDCLHIEGDYLNRYKISEARKSIKECDGDIYKAVETYYERLADWVRTNSGKDLNKAKDSLDFDYINDNFKMIQDSYKVAVLVPYKYGAKLIEKYWDATELTSSDWRSIQPYLGMYSKSEIEKDISIVWRECGVYMREPWQDD